MKKRYVNYILILASAAISIVFLSMFQNRITNINGSAWTPECPYGIVLDSKNNEFFEETNYEPKTGTAVVKQKMVVILLSLIQI